MISECAIREMIKDVFKKLDSNFGLSDHTDKSPAVLRAERENIERDLKSLAVDVSYIPSEDLPLYVNNEKEAIRELVKWRLEHNV